MQLDDLKQDQLIRLRFIEAMLVMTNNVNRMDISDQFDVAAACATRDLRRYKELNPGIEYCPSRRAYCKTTEFRVVKGLVMVKYQDFLKALTVVTTNPININGHIL